MRDEQVLNKQKEPRVGPTLKKHCKSGDFEGNSYLGEDGLGRGRLPGLRDEVEGHVPRVGLGNVAPKHQKAQNLRSTI